MSRGEILRRSLTGMGVIGVALAGLALGASPACAEGTEIRIGEINSYSALPALTEPYRKGWQMAVDEINIAGGVDGKKLTVLSKDDGGKPAGAVAAAADLVSHGHVAMLAGGFFSNVGLALGAFARQHRVLYLAGEPLADALVWSSGNRYTFRLRPSTTMQAAMLAEAAATLPAKTWASIAPNDEDGQSAVAVFKKLLAVRRPDVTWMAEQWPTQGKIDVGPLVQAIAAAAPDAILNLEFGTDLVKLVHEGDIRGLFKDRAVVSFLTGEPEYLDTLKDEAPEGWIVTGYPVAGLRTPDNDTFAKAYQAKYNEMPKMGSVVGYTLIKAAAAILRKAGTTESDKLVSAAEGLAFDSPFGAAQFRAIDHQSTLGTFVGRTAQRNNRGIMTEFAYRDGARYLPGDAEVKAMRPAE